MATIATQTQTSFLDLMKKQTRYNYLLICMQEIPCINWLEFCSNMYRRKHKATTALICCRAMCYLAECYKLKNKNLNNDLATIIEKIANRDTEKEALDQALKLLDEFVEYCDVTKQLLAGSTSVHVRAIKRVLRFAGVKIDNADFKDKVTMPVSTSALEEPPKDEEIRAILNYATPRMRAAIMVMADSGIGRSEVIRLRPKDFHFSEEPVRIVTQRFKTGETIETFVTNETAETVKQLITRRETKPDDYIFVNKLGKQAADKFTEAYNKALKKAGLDQKLEVRIGDVVRQHAYHRFHLHIYRKRWFTKAINVVPAYVAHAMLGRKQYLDQYLAHPLTERQTFYKKISKYVGLFETKADKAEVLAEASKIAGVELSEEKLNAMKALMGQFAKLPMSDIAQIQQLLQKNNQVTKND